MRRTLTLVAVTILAVLGLVVVGARSARGPALSSSQETGVMRSFAAVTRDTEWRLVRRVPLHFDAFHPEGLARVGDRFVLSTVEVLEPTRKYPQPRGGTDRTPGRGRGWLIQFDGRGDKLRETRVDDGGRIYHPGGLDFDGRRLWAAVAEYRPNRPSIIYSVSPRSLRARTRFRVRDHIGAIAHDTARGRIVGLNWGSRRAYEWTPRGRPLHVAENPSHFVDYQDCKFVGRLIPRSAPRLFCDGIAELRHPGVAKYELGGLALVDLPGLVPAHEVPFQEYTPLQGHVGTRNAMDVRAVGDRLRLYLVADDERSELLVYEARPEQG
jgi:Family of unknown function (DUF6454)